MSYIRVLDEGNAVQDRCCEVNFVGAGVAATRPSLNDRVTVTIPSGADVSGWTRIGAGVFLTNIGDTVQIGAAAPLAAEKVRIVNAGGVAARLEGREDFPNVGVAAGAASQARSYVVRWTASMWTGAAAVERDLDVYAAPSTLGADEAGGSRAELVIDYEGWRLLMVQPTAAAPGAVPGVIFRSDAPSGTTVYEWRIGVDIVSPALHTAWTDLNGTVTPLFALDGDGAWSPKLGVAAAAATQVASRRHRFTASMWTGAAEAERDWDVYAVPSTVALDEAGGARTWLNFDFEGNPILQLFTDGAAGGNPIIRSTAPGGATPGMELRVSGNFGEENPAYRFSDTEGVAILGELSGDGSLFLNGLAAAAGASLEYKKHTAYAGSQSRIWTEAYPSTTTGWETAVTLPLDDQRAYSFRATITGINVGRTRWASYELAVGAHREGAGAVLDAFSVTVISETDATWDVQAIQNANNILIQVRAHNFGGDPAEVTYWAFDLFRQNLKSNA